MKPPSDLPLPPFTPLAAAPPLRAAISALTRTPETDLLPALLARARLAPAAAARVQALALRVARGVRERSRDGRPCRPGAGPAAGVCAVLAGRRGADVPGRGLLRIPDAATRDALIRDKIAAATGMPTWGAAPRCSSTPPPGACCSPASWWPRTASGACRPRCAARRPRRRAADPQGRGHGDAHDGRAVRHRRDHRPGAGQRPQARGAGLSLLLRHAGRGGADRDDAERYLPPTSRPSTPSARPPAGRGIYEGPGISIKLSALHPRYSRAQVERVMAELYPRLLATWRCARAATTSALNIDAEEADRLELSLDLLERLCADPRWPAGTASASSSRPTRSAARRWSTTWSTWRGAAASAG
jgi:RHH-type proline utilization regulon transcriptional repressor/proline dehydrogenase/delta 1-pyrroline-5-carboxylate dehydrogenase